ncbi:MAG: glycosyltransferase family 39 protein [Patescibacteria group bacterium]
MKKKTLLFISILYFATRVFNLTVIPIFNDEAIYIRYGLAERLEEVSRHYSLLVGKEPLMPNLYAISGLLFNDLLFGARLITVIFGFLTLWGIYKLCKKYFSQNVAIFASLIYIVNPFTLFFDRLALLDSPVSTIEIWSLYFTLELIHKADVRKALTLGTILGLGFWIKSTSYFYFFLPFVALLVYFIKQRKFEIDKFKMFLISGALTLGIFSLLYFDPLYKVLVEQRKIYTYGFLFPFSLPFNIFWRNIEFAFSFLFFFQTPLIFLAGLSGIVVYLKKKDFNYYIFLLWFILPLLYMILYGKMPTSRYFLILSVPFVILTGIFISKVFEYKKLFGIIVLTSIIAACMVYNSFIYFSPLKFPNLLLGVAKVDATQYFHGFPSGYGVIEAINYLKDLGKDKNITIIVRNDSGNPEDAVVAYLYYNNPNIKVLPVNEPDLKDFDSLKDNLPINGEIYFVSRGAYYVGLEKYFLSEKKFLKPNDNEFVGVQRLNIN